MLQWLWPLAASTLGPDVDDFVAQAMSVWWQMLHDRQSSGPRANPDVLSHFATAAVPYLMRLELWEAASTRTEQPIHHDVSPDKAARLLPFVDEIVRALSAAIDQDLRRRAPHLG